MSWSTNLVNNSVSVGSRKQYNIAWAHWVRFHKCYQIEGGCEDRLSTSRLLVKPAVERGLAFIAYLFHFLHLQASTINNYLAGVAFHLKCRQVDTSFLHSAVMQMARSGVTLLSRGKKAACERGALPFTWSMILAYKQHNSLSVARNHCTYTALAIAFTLLLRVSEYIRSPSNHFLRSQDVVFVLNSGETIPSFRLTASSFSNVASVIFIIRSAKNDQLGESHRLCYPKREDTSLQACICSIAMEWARRAELTADRPFLSYHRRWCLTRRDVDAAVKSMAKHFGLAVHRFSPHSLRYGGASALAARGVPDSIIQSSGRWRSLAFLQYLKLSHHVMTRSLDVLTDPSTFTVEDVRRLTNAAA